MSKVDEAINIILNFDAQQRTLDWYKSTFMPLVTEMTNEEFRQFCYRVAPIGITEPGGDENVSAEVDRGI